VVPLDERPCDHWRLGRGPNSRRGTFAIAGLLALGGCSGSIAGEAGLTRTADGQPRGLAGTPVYVLPATTNVTERINASCDSAIMRYAQTKAEMTRLQAAAASVHATPFQRAATRDSLTALMAARLPDPESLVPQLSSAQSRIDSLGHFAVAPLAHGRYFVVVPGLGWAGAAVAHSRVPITLTPGSAAGACTAIGATYWTR
jgi:hypothetical protein